MAGALTISDVATNYRLGTVQGSWNSDQPDQWEVVIDKPSTSGVALVGQEMKFYSVGGTLLFRGIIDSVGRECLYQGSTRLQVTVYAQGKNVRFYERSLYKYVGGQPEIPVFRSYEGHVNVEGTAVSWVDGDLFDKDMEGTETITIDGTAYVIASVDSPKALTLGSSAGTLSAVDYSYTWASGRAIQWIIDNRLDNEGFTYDGASIDGGAAIKGLMMFPGSVMDGFQAILGLNPGFCLYLEELANSTKVHFHLRTATPAPDEFTDTSGKYRRDVGVTATREDVCNVEVSQVRLESIPPTTYSITGDGAARAWFLPQRAGQIKSVKLNSVTAQVGTEDDTDQDYYYKANGRAFWQDPTLPVLTADDTLEVEFYPLGCDLIEYADDTAIAARALVEGGSGRVERVVDRTSATGQVEANQQAQQNVEGFKSNLEKYVLVTWEEGLRPGQLVTVKDKLGDDTTYFIDSVTATDKGVEGTDYDLLYTLNCSSASRKQAAALLRQVLGGGASGYSSGTAVPTATSPIATTIAAVTLGTITFDKDKSEFIIPFTMPGSGVKPTALHVFAECPDQTSSAVADGSQEWDGTHPATGPQKPIDCGRYAVTATSDRLRAKLQPAPTENMTARVVVVACTDLIEADYADSPSATVAIGPPTASKPVSGIEWAPLVTGLTGTLHTEQVGADWFWWFDLGWTEPTGDINWPEVERYNIVLHDPSIADPSKRYALVADVRRGGTTYTLDTMWRVPDTKVPYRIYVQTVGRDGENSIVPGVTPYMEFMPEAVPDDDGREVADLLGIAFSATPAWETDAATGQPRFKIPLALTHPTSDPRYGWAYLVLLRSGGGPPQEQNIVRTQDEATFYVTAKDGFPTSSETFTVYGYSIDKNGERNTYKSGVTPVLTVTVGPPYVDAPVSNVTGFSVAYEYGDPDNDGRITLDLTETCTIPTTDPKFYYFEWWAKREDGVWYNIANPASSGEVWNGHQLPKVSYTWEFMAVAIDVNGKNRSGAAKYNPNTDGAAPSGTATCTLMILPPAEGSAGTEYVANVTGFAGGGTAGAAVEYRQNAEGSEEFRLVLTWVRPASTRFGGVHVVVRWNPATTPVDVPVGYTGPDEVMPWRSGWMPVGAAAPMKVYAPAITNGPQRENTIVDGTTPSIGPVTVETQLGKGTYGGRIDTGDGGPIEVADKDGAVFCKIGKIYKGSGDTEDPLNYYYGISITGANFSLVFDPTAGLVIDDTGGADRDRVVLTDGYVAVTQRDDASITAVLQSNDLNISSKRDDGLGGFLGATFHVSTVDGSYVMELLDENNDPVIQATSTGLYARMVNTGSLQIGGNTVIDASRNAAFATIKTDSITTTGAIPKADTDDTLTESAIVDDGSAVKIAGRKLEVRAGGSISQQLHISSADDDRGFWAGAHGDNTGSISFGAEFVQGTGWVARSTVAMILYSDGTALKIFHNTGLTIDAAYTPTLVGTYTAGAGWNIPSGEVYKVAGTQVVKAREADPGTAASSPAVGVSSLMGTAGATYTAAEQTLINNLITQEINTKTAIDNLKAQVDNLITDRDRLRTVLQNHGLMA